ncbi:MAG: non-hydrolyzing UDP-N-acetylglucosamine 2-epimerase, partial [Planctomycetota bacterium]|jgi:UDP-GlcNAc3NAcA epimerase
MNASGHLKALSVVGARPQFIKAAVVSKAILESGRMHEVIVHTGQHYDEAMSQIFFDELKIPKPKYNLEVGSGTHGHTTGQMLSGIERVVLEERPDWVLVYGDTNSTLAGALAAAKLHVPVAHVEAGLRSFNKRMPEEINRILTDHVSSLLFCPTTTAVKNLRNEGINEGIHHVGDVMYDAALLFGSIAERQSDILRQLELLPESYYLATVHRAENTDDPVRLMGIFKALDEIATEESPIVLPLHPRTRAALLRDNLASLIEGPNGADAGVATENKHLRLICPVSFLDMVMLERHARAILTDSGGIQKEAYFHGIPCVTLREETEWTETVEVGWNRLAGNDTKVICECVRSLSGQREIIEEYGNGDSAKVLVDIMGEFR